MTSLNFRRPAHPLRITNSKLAKTFAHLEAGAIKEKGKGLFGRVFLPYDIISPSIYLFFDLLFSRIQIFSVTAETFGLTHSNSRRREQLLNLRLNAHDPALRASTFKFQTAS
jgi:hypothetical protein